MSQREQLIAYTRAAPIWQPSTVVEERPIDASSTATTNETTAPTEPPPDLATLLDQIETFIRAYMVMTPEQRYLVALWIVLTHAIEAFDFVAYLHIHSPEAKCGKSRLLDLLNVLVNRPWKTGRVTAAVLMRKNEAVRPTLLLDETDAAFHEDREYAEALRGMLDTGFQRGGSASTCIGQGANIQYKDFSTFGPKALAGIGRLPATIESRSIPITLARRLKHEGVEKLRLRKLKAAADPLRLHIAAVAASHLDAWRDREAVMPEGLDDREEDVLEPLFVIADSAGETSAARARQAALAIMGSARADRQATIGVELLTDIHALIEADGWPAQILTRQLLEKLNSMDDRPWATCRPGDRPLTAHKLKELLKSFEIHPGGKLDGNLRGYRVAAFEEAFARYLGIEVAEWSTVNETGPETAKTEVEYEASTPLRKPGVAPDIYWESSTSPLRSPGNGREHENAAPPNGDPAQESRQARQEAHDDTAEPARVKPRPSQLPYRSVFDRPVDPFDPTAAFVKPDDEL